MIDVLVVGGGPAGLATAEAAARGGLAVELVHADAAFGRPVRTSGASWRAELVRLGLPSSLWREIATLAFAGPSALATFAFDPSERPVVLDVTATYRWLAGRARSAGATLHTGTRFRALASTTPDHVEAVVSDRNGERTVRARTIVDASGHRRAVLEAAGLRTHAVRVGVGAEYEFVNLDAGDDRAVLFVGPLAPSGYGWIFPTPRDTVRVGVGVIRPDSHAPPAELLRAFIDGGGLQRFDLRVGEIVERHGGVVPSEGLASRFVHGRIIAAGDSAGQVLPLVGEGIRYCIESGRVLGHALAQGTLDEYDAWWQARHRASFARAQWINERIGHFHDRGWDTGVRFLATLSSHDAARLIRMESSRRDLARFALAHPLRAARFGREWVRH